VKHVTENQVYQIPRGQSLGVRLDRRIGDPTRVSAQLVTVSRSDAQLVVCSEIEEQETVRIRMRHDPVIKIDLPGTVTCVLRTASDEWLAHCAFEDEISEEVLLELVKAGCLEACEAQDRLLPASAELQWESDSMKAPVILQNFSASGFCVSSPRSASDGDRLRLVLENVIGQRLLIKAAAHWHQKAVGEGFVLGCTFASIREYYRLRSFLSQSPPEVDEPCEAVPCLSYASQVGTVAVLCCNYLHLL